jgi:hypothetical protein
MLQEADVDIFAFRKSPIFTQRASQNQIAGRSGQRRAHFQNAGDLLGLPIDDTGQQERQAAAGVHLLIQFAGVDSSSPPVMGVIAESVLKRTLSGV